MAGRASDTSAQAASTSPSTMATMPASTRLPKGLLLSFPDLSFLDLRSHDSEVYCSTDLTYALLAMQIRLVFTVTFMFMLLDYF
jgi:hypothetical protein